MRLSISSIEDVQKCIIQRNILLSDDNLIHQFDKKIKTTIEPQYEKLLNLHKSISIFTLISMINFFNKIKHLLDIYN